MRDLRKSLRDENNWAIPKEGTLSHKIYLMLRDGKGTGQIAKDLQHPSQIVRVLAHKIRRQPKVKTWVKPKVNRTLN